MDCVCVCVCYRSTWKTAMAFIFVIRRYDPAQQTTAIRRDTKLECERNSRFERYTYLFRARKLDMEMPPDGLEAGRLNDLFVAGLSMNVLQEYRRPPASLVHTWKKVPTHTAFTSIMLSGAVCLIVFNPGPSLPQCKQSCEQYHQEPSSLRGPEGLPQEITLLPQTKRTRK